MRYSTLKGIVARPRLLFLLLPVGLLIEILTSPSQRQGLAIGVGSGALIGALGICIIITYKGSGVVNFAAGAVAMFSSVVYRSLTAGGKIPVLPIPNPLKLIQGAGNTFGASWRLPDIPTFISLGRPLSTWWAIAATVALAALSGILIELVVFRRLRAASTLMKSVVTVGIVLTLSSAVTLRLGSNPLAIAPILSGRGIRVPGFGRIPASDLVLLGAVIVAAIGLSLLFGRTRFGLRTRAGAENEKGAALLGFSSGSLAVWNSALAMAVSALVGIFAASINQSVDPLTLTLLAVPALAAALLGNFSSFSLTVVAGIIIGMSQSWLESLASLSWYPKVGGSPLPGAQQMLPVLIIVGALYLRGRGVPERGSIHRIPLPFAPEPRHVIRRTAIGVVAVALGLLLLGPDWRLSIIDSLAGVLICLSFVIIIGFVGQISLAQMALAGTSGFLLSKLAGAYHIPFPFAPLIGVVGAVAVGMVVAIPALRIRGVSLAVVTLAASAAIEQAVFNNGWFESTGVATVAPAKVGGFTVSLTARSHFNILGIFRDDHKIPNPMFGLVWLVVVAIVVVLISNLRRSSVGQQMLAVRANERAAAGAGVTVGGMKLLGFGIAATVAGLGGVMIAYTFGSASDATFGGLASLSFLAFAYLGGISSVGGALVGGTMVSGGIGYVILSTWFGVDPAYAGVVGGVGLIVTAVLNPQGIAGANREMLERLRRWRLRRLRSYESDEIADPTPALAPLPALSDFQRTR